MRILLDTQAVIWFVDQDHLLSPTAHAAIADPSNDLLLSAATMGNCHQGRNREAIPGPALSAMDDQGDQQSETNPLANHGRVRRLPSTPQHHGDPFDRLIVSQALTEKAPVISIDTTFDSYGVNRLW
jgi:PIN domain nuclease of toxin-antitoxin system